MMLGMKMAGSVRRTPARARDAVQYSMMRGGAQVHFLILAGALAISATPLPAQPAAEQSGLTVARVKYHGGGDWYNDPSCIPNLLKFVRENTTVDAETDEQHVELLADDLFSHPILFLTGHGRMSFSTEEARRLRLYLTSGGFLYADDDYGMDKSFREEMKKVFPDKQFVELPFSHPLFHSHFEFSGGIPKIHEHDGGAGKTFGIFHEGRLVVLYTWNTNISDGWADPDVHNDPPEIRRQALQMGTNIVVYALMR